MREEEGEQDNNIRLESFCVYSLLKEKKKINLIGQCMQYNILNEDSIPVNDKKNVLLKSSNVT